MVEGEKTFTADNSGRIAFSPPAHLILRDETGQPWAISVRPDGQLQTARWPDGEAVSFVREISTEKIIEIVRNEAAEMLESMFKSPTIEELQEKIKFFHETFLDNPSASGETKRAARHIIAEAEREITRLVQIDPARLDE